MRKSNENDFGTVREWRRGRTRGDGKHKIFYPRTNQSCRLLEETLSPDNLGEDELCYQSPVGCRCPLLRNLIENTESKANSTWEGDKMFSSFRFLKRIRIHYRIIKCIILQDKILIIINYFCIYPFIIFVCFPPKDAMPAFIQFWFRFNY